MQTIMVAASAVDNDKPFITANTMFGMHHQITGLKRADLAQKIIAAAALGLRARQPLTENIRLSNDQKMICLKAGL